MNSEKNLIEYGWDKHLTEEGEVIVRIPKTDDVERLFFYSKELDEKCLGIPETFKDGVEFQYLAKDFNREHPLVYVLKRTIDELIEKIDYIKFTSQYGVQYEIRVSLWEKHDYDQNSFPLIKQSWLKKRFNDFNKYNKQRRLPL